MCNQSGLLSGQVWKTAINVCEHQYSEQDFFLVSNVLRQQFKS